MHLYEVLRRPIITEKTTLLQGQNKYVFAVATAANKAQIKEAVEQAFNVTVDLPDVKKDDIKVEMQALCEIAKQRGVNVKALRKVAREMIMDSAKLEKIFEDEDQLEMFREEVGINQRKGISEIPFAKTTTLSLLEAAE